MSGVPVTFRVTYARYGELRDDIAHQMVRGGLLVKVHDAPTLAFDSPVALELVMPDGTTLYTAGKVLQVFTGFGVAVSVDPQVVEEVGRLARRPDVTGAAAARHERVDTGRPRRAPTARPHSSTRPPALGTGTSPPLAARPAQPSALGTGASPPLAAGPAQPSALGTAATPPLGTAASPALAIGSSPAMSPPAPARSSPAMTLPSTSRSSPAMTLPSTSRSSPAITLPAAPGAAGSTAHEVPRSEGPSRIEKVQLALHGTRDERNAILRDRDRTLYPFVLKNPQLDADDVVAIAKNPQMTSELLQQIGERKDWLQRPAVALALARNPRTPSALAVRALEHVPLEALRQMAKGTGVPPHVTQAARKKLLG